VVVDAAPEMPRGGGGGDEKHEKGGKRKKKDDAMDDAMDAVSPEDGTDGKTLGERARDAERGLSRRSTRDDADANDALAGAVGDALGDVQNAKRPPRADSLAVLFAQALAAEDRSLIERCLSVGDAGVVSNTVARLPASSVPKLLRAALDRMRAKPARGEQIARWMRAAMLHHASHIASSALAKTAVLELTQTVEQHRALQRPLQALLGRLDLLLHKQSEAKRARDGRAAATRAATTTATRRGPVNVYDEGDEDLEDVMEEGDEESDWETDGETDGEGEEEEDSDDDESDSE
jgi:U3 small nucleolar RNA-associated protein 5